MRIMIDDKEVFELKSGNVPNSILIKIEREENKEVSEKLLKGINKAREKRTNNTNKKIENAINTLYMENKKITVYSVSKLAGVSFNTCKKDKIKEMIEKREEARTKNNK